MTVFYPLRHLTDARTAICNRLHSSWRHRRRSRSERSDRHHHSLRGQRRALRRVKNSVRPRRRETSTQDLRHDQLEGCSRLCLRLHEHSRILVIAQPCLGSGPVLYLGRQHDRRRDVYHL